MNPALTVPFCPLDNFPAERLDLLRQHKPGDAGVDLIAAEPALLFSSGKQVVVRCGIKVAIPAGFVGLVCPRSGLAAKHGVTVVNAPGIIDSGYRGEVMVILALVNGAPDCPTSFPIGRGDRIAQLVVVPCPPVMMGQYTPDAFEQEFGNTARGTGGLGSTGR